MSKLSDKEKTVLMALYFFAIILLLPVVVFIIEFLIK